jgi:hypothetical protein
MKIIIPGKTKSEVRNHWMKYLLSAYNRAKACGEFEQGRVNRALGLAIREVLRGDTRPYRTSVSVCDCKDYWGRKKYRACKHMISKMIVQRAQEYVSVEIQNARDVKRAEKLAEQKAYVDWKVKRHNQTVDEKFVKNELAVLGY